MPQKACYLKNPTTFLLKSLQEEELLKGYQQSDMDSRRRITKYHKQEKTS